MVQNGKSHESLILGHKTREERQFVEHLEPESRMILRYGVVERAVERELAKAPHIVKKSHDFRQLHIVRREPQMLGKLHGNRGHTASMHLLHANRLLHLLVLRIEGAHVSRHPSVHLTQ